MSSAPTAAPASATTATAPRSRSAAPRSSPIARATRSALGRQGDDRDVVERLGPGAAQPDHQRRDDAVGARRDEQLEPRRRHPLDQQARPRLARLRQPGQARVRGGEFRGARDPELERADRGLVLDRRAAELDGDRPAEPGGERQGAVEVVRLAAGRNRDPRSRDQSLRLRLAEPTAGRSSARPERWRPRRSRAAAPGPRPGGRAPRRRRSRCAGRRRSVPRAQRARRRPRSSSRSGSVEAKIAAASDSIAPGGKPLADGRPLDARAPARALAGGRNRAAAGRSPGSSPDRRRDSARGARSRPRSARCSRAGWRWLPRRAAAPPAARAVAAASSGSSTPAALRLVGGEPRVAARAGEHRDPRAARAGARLGQHARELEQLVRVGRPGAARLLDQSAENALVAGERAGVRGGGAGARL